MPDKERAFLEYKRVEPGYRPVEERTKDFKAVEQTLSNEEIHKQAARCMNCGTPFCHACGCPLQNNIPEINELVYRGKWKEAAEILFSTSNFPEFTARICPALCEGSCVLGINDEPVSIRQLELAVIETAFKEGFVKPEPPAKRLPFKVAISGSGPAGLAAADCLNNAGCSVTIFDADPKPGGILRYGIPDFKLEKWVIDRRIEIMKQEGIIFEMNAAMGDDISARFLKSRFDAICLAGGAREPRDLKIPGRNLQNIYFALPYLIQQNKRVAGEPINEEEIYAAGKKVLVIGGGDTGSDCIGTAIRQGALSILQVELLPKPPAERASYTPWPHWPVKLRYSSSHLEGGERKWSIITKEFIGKDGKVSAAKMAEVNWETDETGKPVSFKEKAGSDFVVETDLVLLALGFIGPKHTKLIEDLGVTFNEKGTITTNKNSMTSVPGVFVAGDMAQGATLVVRAIADGRAAAQGILRYLLNKTT